MAFNIGQEYQLGDQGVEQVFPTVGSFFSTILFNLFGLIGLILIFLLIFGALNIIIGAGRQDSGRVQQGQKALTAAIIGLAVVFASYFIVQIIETITGVQILNPTI